MTNNIAAEILCYRGRALIIEHIFLILLHRASLLV